MGTKFYVAILLVRERVKDESEDGGGDNMNLAARK